MVVVCDGRKARLHHSMHPHPFLSFHHGYMRALLIVDVSFFPDLLTLVVPCTRSISSAAYAGMCA